MCSSSVSKMNFLVMTVNFQPTLWDNTIQMSVASCVLPADSTRGPRVQCSSYGSSLGYGSGCTGAPAEWDTHQCPHTLQLQSSGQSSPLTASSKASSEVGAERTLKRSLVRTLMPGAGEWVLLSTLFSLRRQKTFLRHFSKRRIWALCSWTALLSFEF